MTKSKEEMKPAISEFISEKITEGS